MRAGGAQTLTIAPEAGSRRLRDVISKTQTEAQLLEAVELAAELDFPQIKFYFMIGHPTETEEDIDELVEFVRKARGLFKRRIAMNATPFVPKAHTPFQWMAMTDAKTLKKRQQFIQRQVGRMKVAVRADSPAWAEVQGVLSRGDRRLAQVLLDIPEADRARFLGDDGAARAGARRIPGPAFTGNRASRGTLSKAASAIISSITNGAWPNARRPAPVARPTAPVASPAGLRRGLGLPVHGRRAAETAASSENTDSVTCVKIGDIGFLSGRSCSPLEYSRGYQCIINR